MKTGKDPFTGEIFVKTRRNQIYASRENQVKFNNQKAFDKRQEQYKINQLLKTNFKILEKTLKENDEVKVEINHLIAANFNFGCITHVYKEVKEVWYCIYNLGYTKISKTEYQLKKMNHGT